MNEFPLTIAAQLLEDKNIGFHINDGSNFKYRKHIYVPGNVFFTRQDIDETILKSALHSLFEMATDAVIRAELPEGKHAITGLVHYSRLADIDHKLVTMSLDRRLIRSIVRHDRVWFQGVRAGVHFWFE